jgi:hypothetical protein
MMTKLVKPSPSYEFKVPEEICEEHDQGVSSYWLEGSSLLFQVSSFIRGGGEQIHAQERLKVRMSKHAETWTVVKEKLYPDSVVDQASATFTDENEFRWIHTYLVWPHLTIYVTISSPSDLVANNENWAIQSLKSISLVLH